MAAYMVFETGHTFGPSMLYPVYRSVVRSAPPAIYSAKSIKDNKLLIDVEAIKEMISKKEVEKVQWIAGEKMLANALTKRGAASWDLINTIQKGHLLI